MSKSFNVVIATAGRDTLQRMVDSIAPQLTERDYLTIIWDCEPRDIRIDSECKYISIHNPEPLGYWGHGSRTRWQNELPGDYLLNGDDDNVYTEDAMETIRQNCTEEKLYLFQINNRGHKIPISEVVEIGNVDTGCGVYPKVLPSLPKWEYVYCGDGEFYKSLSKMLPVVFIKKVIQRIRPGQSLVKVAGEYVD